VCAAWGCCLTCVARWAVGLSFPGQPVDGTSVPCVGCVSKMHLHPGLVCIADSPQQDRCVLCKRDHQKCLRVGRFWRGFLPICLPLISRRIDPYWSGRGRSGHLGFGPCCQQLPCPHSRASASAGQRRPLAEMCGHQFPPRLRWGNGDFDDLEHGRARAPFRPTCGGPVSGPSYYVAIPACLSA
jgi:hypothetical protein